MSTFKQSVKILFLFVLLFAVVLIPGRMMDVYSSGLLNDISLYPVGMVQVDHAEGLTIWERAELLNGDVTQVQSSDYVNLREDDTAIRNLEEQIQLLQEYKVLPDLRLPEYDFAFCSQRIYMDPENLERSVQVWQIGVVYGTLYVDAHIDAETSALYKISIYDERGITFVYDYLDISAQGFLSYLATFAQDGSLPDGEITVYHHYAADMIDLSLISATSSDPNSMYQIYVAPGS